MCSLIVDHRGDRSHERVSRWMNISVRPLSAQAAFFSPEKKWHVPLKSHQRGHGVWGQLWGNLGRKWIWSQPCPLSVKLGNFLPDSCFSPYRMGMMAQLTQGSAVWIESRVRCHHLQRLCEACSFGDLGMAQLVRCLLNNSKGLSSIPRTDGCGEAHL